MTGGYDDGYAKCGCLWGKEPGSFVRGFAERSSVSGLRVLDLGCGEGKNAVHLARLGAVVRAVEVSDLALQNAAANWPGEAGVSWEHADVMTVDLPPDTYDVVVMYGLLHCLESAAAVGDLVQRAQAATKRNGVHIVCAFNSRYQDLSAHPEFRPVLLPHAAYEELYAAWNVEESTDTDLEETHPHNGILHTHSLTRLRARR